MNAHQRVSAQPAPKLRPLDRAEVVRAIDEGARLHGDLIDQIEREMPHIRDRWDALAFLELTLTDLRCGYGYWRSLAAQTRVPRNG